MQLSTEIFQIFDVARFRQRVISKVLEALWLVDRRQELAPLALLCGTRQVALARRGEVFPYRLSASLGTARSAPPRFHRSSRVLRR